MIILIMSCEDFKTVGDLRKAIINLPDDMPLIYSHDDEGNEYQRVIFSPGIQYIVKQREYRFLKISKEQTVDDVVKCLCIN